MFKLTDHPKTTECISFESYPSRKKFLSCIEDPKGEVEVEAPKDPHGGVNGGRGGGATFKADIFACRNLLLENQENHIARYQLKV